MEGHDVVFHVAALPGVWGDPAEFERTNVLGTENVVRTCEEHGIRTLVNTGSPSSVFDGKDHLDAGNDLPYPPRFEADYPRTKAAAEKIVLGANGAKLATTSLRPHLIYGPEDTWLLPRVFDRAKKRRLRIVGAGENRVSLTYIENAAAAHLQAAAALVPGAACAGKPFFVTDPEPIVLWPWLNRLLEGVGLPPVTRHVSLGTAHAAGTVAEWVWRTFRLSGDPLMTRFMAGQLGTSHTYSLRPAQEAFGYAPPVPNDEAFRRTVEWWRGRVG
jgi:nucleoside-diphosphate-sugar epimerase